jgi:hypothetical protein
MVSSGYLALQSSAPILSSAGEDGLCLPPWSVELTPEGASNDPCHQQRGMGTGQGISQAQRS